MHLDLIVGLALDYFEDIKYSFEEVFKLFAPELQLGFLKFLKGTPLRDKHNQHGFKFDTNPPYQIIESHYLSKEELHKITVVEHSLEVYWNKKRAINTLKYVTANYSIFDFLLGLGLHFESKRDFHKFSLNDIFEILTEYISIHFSKDKVLIQLAAVDYYLHHKVKPQTQFLEEIDRADKNTVIELKRLNHHKYRYIILPVDFNFQSFLKDSTIEKIDSTIIIQYDGVNKATIIFDEV